MSESEGARPERAIRDVDSERVELGLKAAKRGTMRLRDMFTRTIRLEMGQECGSFVGC